jgi:hypothetical protein
MWHTPALQKICAQKDAEYTSFKKQYDPYVDGFIKTMLHKAKYHWTWYHQELHLACSRAKTKKDRFIVFHYYLSTDHVYVDSTYVFVDELIRYTDVLRRLEAFFGPHFKVRAQRVMKDPNFSHAITLHYFP